MRAWVALALQSTILVLPVYISHAQRTGVFSEPDSELLFGMPYNSELHVVSPAGTITVKSPPGSFKSGFYQSPALAPDGDHVAWSFVEPANDIGLTTRMALAVYSLHDHSWKNYGDACTFDGGGSAAFSSDGEKAAFLSSTGRSDEKFGFCKDGEGVLRIFDLTTAKSTFIPTDAWPTNRSLSWSPDGNEIAIQADGIEVVNLESGKSRNLGSGTDPSWAPKGNWISYIDQDRKDCVLVRPDGTGMKVFHILTYHWFRDVPMLVFGSVWSPDGTKLLLNVSKGENGIIDVLMLDLATGKVRRVSKNGSAVFGWVRQSRR
jgi:Tol biopolymer transport system component